MAAHEVPRASAPETTSYRGDCPLCGGEGKLAADFKVDRLGLERWLITCPKCSARGLVKGDFLRELAVALDTTAAELHGSPLRYLGPGRAGGSPRRAELPTDAQIEGWHDRLLSSVDPLHHLTLERGLSLETVEAHKLGWNGERIVFPVYVDGALANTRLRALPGQGGPKVQGLAGRGVQLYPDVPRQRRSLMLVAGELDALLARQYGLPAVTSTCGASLPDPLLVPLRPEGRRVAVVFDVGEESAAERTVEKLCAAGAAAWAVPLGLPEKGGDVSDWFLGHGRSAERLRRRIRRARRAAS